MAHTTKGMTISKLSSLSAIPRSTIKFYIRESLIPRPNKIRGTRAYYDARHLNKLRLIKKSANGISAKRPAAASA